MADERVGHWEDVYREKEDTQLSWHQDDPSLSLELCDLAGVDKGSSVVDIGGGTSRFAERLIEKGLSDVSVLDVSEAALDRSRRQLGPVGDRIVWIAADVTTWNPDRSYDHHRRGRSHRIPGTAISLSTPGWPCDYRNIRARRPREMQRLASRPL